MNYKVMNDSYSLPLLKKPIYEEVLVTAEYLYLSSIGWSIQHFIQRIDLDEIREGSKSLAELLAIIKELDPANKLLSDSRIEEYKATLRSGVEL